MEPKITWLGHASFRIEGSKTVYIDPWKLDTNQPQADIILITHEHYDHCSPEDVTQISGASTIIVTEKDSKAKLSGDIRVMAPGDHLVIDDIEIDAVPAYNIDKRFHPKSRGWIGFVFTLDGTRFYHTGPTGTAGVVALGKEVIEVLNGAVGEGTQPVPLVQILEGLEA